MTTVTSMSLLPSTLGCSIHEAKQFYLSKLSPRFLLQSGGRFLTSRPSTLRTNLENELHLARMHYLMTYAPVSDLVEYMHKRMGGDVFGQCKRKRDREAISSSSSSVAAAARPTPRPKERVKRMKPDSVEMRHNLLTGSYLDGEHSSNVMIEHFGVLGMRAEYCGNGLIVPHGIRGTCSIFGEEWMFEVQHRAYLPNGRLLLAWRVTNVATKKLTEVVENERDAVLRGQNGRTIAGAVYKQAIHERITQLRLSITDPDCTEMKRQNVLERVASLDKRKFTRSGVQHFGLKHRTTYERMLREIDMRKT